MINYDNVVRQFQEFGLRPRFPLEIGQLIRCKVEGEQGTKGWYIVHDMQKTGGDVLLVGTFGVWHGADNGLQKITLDKSNTLSTEQKKAFAKRMAEERKQAAAFQKKRADTAARKAEAAWHNASENGEHEYLDRKGAQAFGVRFTDKGAMAIPVSDVTGKIHGLQLILDRKKHKDQLKNNGTDKIFWPPGTFIKGHFHLIGSPTDILLITEGYATGASLHMATGLPVAVAFNANNLMSVTEAIKKRYKGIKIIVCADDDAFSKCKHCKEPVNVNQSPDCPHCKKPHGKKNTGVEAASLVAMSLNCHWIRPEFSDPAAIFEAFCKKKGKSTDFNDLHLTDGLHLVRTQVDNAIDRFQLRGAMLHGANAKQGGGADDNDNKIAPIARSDELLERFSLIYGAGGTVFDSKEHVRVTLSDMRDACMRRDIHRDWQESPIRKIVRPENVGFDPACNDENISCNLWSGWPTEPKKGKCEVVLELLEHMCSDDDMYQWVLKWIAYPIQNPGAKMRTAIVVHGPQGTGKNLFFECVMSIYGQYGRIIDQSAIEDKFNEWGTKKLFLIADEVVARTDLYHVKNKLKCIITGEWMRINPKNMVAYDEKNHINMVFLSNERMPVVLEKDDRRHAVIWTPDKLSPDFYKDVATEIKNEGIEALHDFLLNLPLENFNEHTKPPLNLAKEDLIELGKDSVIRFYDQYTAGELEGFELTPVIGSDIYELYKLWCARQGVRFAPLHRVVDTISKQPGVKKDRPRYMDGSKERQKRFLFPDKYIQPGPGEDVKIWLGQCVEDFRDALEIYKEAEYA